MAELSEAAFFVREGDGYRATVFTRGPWDERFQHGGPPCALLATALHEGVEAQALARVSYEFLRPVPIETLQVEVEDVSSGRTVRRRLARLIADGRVVLEARAVFVRQLETHEEVFGEPWSEPERLEPFRFPFFPWEEGYHQAIDGRLLDGPWGKTPQRCWARSRVPLILGEEDLPEAHAIALADAESGMGPPCDPLQWTYVNPDLTVFFARRPEPRWVGLDIRSFDGGAGTGLSEARLRDARGVFGRSAQSMLIAPRADD